LFFLTFLVELFFLSVLSSLNRSLFSVLVEPI